MTIDSMCKQPHSPTDSNEMSAEQDLDKSGSAERFDHVDWSDHTTQRWRDLSINTIGILLTSAPLVLLWAYDTIFITERGATLAFIGLELWSPRKIIHALNSNLFLISYGINPLIRTHCTY